MMRLPLATLFGAAVLLTGCQSPDRQGVSAEHKSAPSGLLHTASAEQKGRSTATASALPAAAVEAKRAAGPVYVYVGSYAKPEQEGIHIFRMDPKTGALTPTGGVAGVNNPSFLATNPQGSALYAASEIYGGSGGVVHAFSIDRATGALTALGAPQSARGDGTCHVSLSPSGKYVLAANYGGGTVAVLPVGANGALGTAVGFDQHKGGSGVNTRRQGQPYAHSFDTDPAGRFAVSCDLGADKLFVYNFDNATGNIQPATPAFTATHPGAGPRHFAFHPAGRWAYAINELDSTVAVYDYDKKLGKLSEKQVISSLPKEGAEGNSPAEILAEPTGRFLYGSNRGHNSIVEYAIDPGSGKLRLVGHTPTGGKNPRHFAMAPGGRFLIVANQDTNNLVLFRVDPGTGALIPTGQKVSVEKPVCVAFVPSR